MILLFSVIFTVLFLIIPIILAWLKDPAYLIICVFLVSIPSIAITVQSYNRNKIIDYNNLT
jgi:hypothetical protein